MFYIIFYIDFLYYYLKIFRDGVAANFRIKCLKSRGKNF